MAKDLDIKKCWYHKGKAPYEFPHYDIPKRRIKEIKAKCLVINVRLLLSIIKYKIQDVNLILLADSKGNKSVDLDYIHLDL